MERFDNLLCRYRSPKETRRTASRIHLLVMEVGPGIARIPKDPLSL